MRKLATLVLVSVLIGFGAAQEPITIGSKIDTEGNLLAQMIGIMLEQNGIEVVDRSGFGTTSVVRQALLAGEIDLYPEYTGTALTFFPDVDFDPALSTQPEKLYERVKELDMERNGVVWLGHAPANNTWAIAVPKDLAEANGLVTMADFARYVQEGNPVKLAASQEFVDRPDALPAFEQTYGFELGADQLVILAGGNTLQTETAANRGTDGVNAAMAYGTDGSLAALDLVALEDPKNAVAIYQPAPIVRAETAQAYPKLGEILDPVLAALDRATLQELNARIAVNGEDPADVARDYLQSKGFIGG